MLPVLKISLIAAAVTCMSSAPATSVEHTDRDAQAAACAGWSPEVLDKGQPVPTDDLQKIYVARTMVLQGGMDYEVSASGCHFSHPITALSVPIDQVRVYRYQGRYYIMTSDQREELGITDYQLAVYGALPAPVTLGDSSLGNWPL